MFVIYVRIMSPPEGVWSDLAGCFFRLVYIKIFSIQQLWALIKFV